MEEKEWEPPSDEVLFSIKPDHYEFGDYPSCKTRRTAPAKHVSYAEVSRKLGLVALSPIFLLAKFGYWLVREIRRQNEGLNFGATPREASEVAASPRP